MATRITGRLDDPALRSRMGKAAREAASVFSPEVIAAKTLDIYERVIAHHQSIRSGAANSKFPER